MSPNPTTTDLTWPLDSCTELVGRSGIVVAYGVTVAGRRYQGFMLNSTIGIPLGAREGRELVRPPKHPGIAAQDAIRARREQ